MLGGGERAGNVEQLNSLRRAFLLQRELLDFMSLHARLKGDIQIHKYGADDQSSAQGQSAPSQKIDGPARDFKLGIASSSMYITIRSLHGTITTRPA
jgi:hypothetical protein